ncbi:MAG: PilX N-terminal domain-containing pilus assembly protein [Alteromonadaceae bacterium]|nr:PilX N-terminal domain-containing pilus assembly protein [Alteromonadaceae bacterium]
MKRNPVIGLEKQRGAVLVISLVILLVVTLLGVGALETAVFQERMAANSQNKNVAFQDTASLLEDILRDPNVLGGTATVLNDAIVRGVGEPSNVTNYAADDPVSAEYSVTYMGESNPFVAPGQETSLSSPIPQRRFELRMTTENANTQAGTSHIQGFVPN